jgi:hypothetical protein
MSKSQSPIYAKFESFEEQLAHCYFMLHERFITNPPLARFWVEAAMDELHHRSILQFCRERGVMADAEFDSKVADRIQELLDTVKGIVTDPELSVHEAFYAALLMEFSELEDFYEKMTSALLKEHQALFDAVRANLHAHHATFAGAAAEFCSDRGMAAAFNHLAKA